MFQPARVSQPINHPGARKGSSRHDSAAQNLPTKCLIFYHVHIRPVFSGCFVKNIAYIADSKPAEGEGVLPLFNMALQDGVRMPIR